MIKKYTCGTKYVLKYERRSTEKGLKNMTKKKGFIYGVIKHWNLSYFIFCL